MKCIHCDRDSNYKERTGKKCPKCGREFAFEPREGDIVTDMLFHKAIEAVSAEGKIRWGVEHLYYEINRRKRGRPVPVWLIAVLFGVFGTSLYLAFPFHPGWGLLAALTGIAAFTWTRRQFRRFVIIEQTKFDAQWRRWCTAHGTPKTVIQRRPQAKANHELEPDIGDYSFDRAVICDRGRTVDLLLANNFHFENNCAVLSIDGYPKGPFATVKAMLKRNPKLQVFALHDATPKGCQLAPKLATDPDWFGGGPVKVIDVGLRPIHAKSFRGLWQRAKKNDLPLLAGLPAAEAAWLESCSLELAAVRPEQVLKRLFRAINRRFDPNESTDSGVLVGDGGGSSGGGDADHSSFAVDAGDSDDGADSFG